MHRRAEQVWASQCGLDANAAAVGPRHEMHGPRIEAFNHLDEIVDMKTAVVTLAIVRPGARPEIAPA
ncbi:hypothetical protein CDZ97_10050 [Mameliella alba]|nr:hypothetical protein CDZ97_10050 [Mameliella alba]